MQEAYELSFSLIPRILGGNKATVIHGLDQTHAINNELLLLMDEMMISVRRMLEGIDVNEETLAFNMSKITKLIEKYIREYPSEWAWMHRRWKSKLSETSKSFKRRRQQNV